MKISAADVEHVALLSRLELSGAEREKHAAELSRIFEYVEALYEVDVSGVAPTSHSIPQENVFRRDEVRAGLSNAEALANAPQSEDGCFKVPQIV